ncbi:MAG: AI-2E family transporter [Flavobacteriaceae bacterium]|nr:AI-2E family transporter [Flavobacteriaceae bacterium]
MNESNITNKNLTDIKKLLLIMVVPLVLYMAKILSFIFIPLVAAIFLSLLFMPMMRWFEKRNIPKYLSVSVVLVIIVAFNITVIFLLKLSAKEVMSVGDDFWAELSVKINDIVISSQEFIGVPSDRQGIDSLLASGKLSRGVSSNFGKIFKAFTGTITMSLMTLFFLILLLAGSLNVQKIMEKMILGKAIPAIKTYIIIEKSIVKFIKVKFLLSLFTGIGFSLACLYFDVKFPLFWGLLTFGLNFVQMIGSIVSVFIVGVFGIAQLDPSSGLLLFILSLVAVQVIFGSILEPILMGKTFALNTITVLVMLMFWGFIWGIPGLILSIPITVFVKIILEQLPQTKEIAKMMA